MPLAGYKIYNSSYNMGNHSMYWSATTDTVYTTNAFFLEIWSTGDIGPTNSIDRMWESSVRCIKGTAPIIPNSCANNPVFTNLGTTTTGTPTSVGQAWTYSATPGNCTYVCTGGYSGTNCATAPIFTNRYP